MASNKMLIDASHPEETRVVVMRGNRIEEFDFESQNKQQLRGNIYLAKVTRVEPSLQAAFVDYGGNRHGFLAFNEIHPDYYQIPIADRQALLEEEAAEANRMRQQDDEEEAPKPKRKRRSRKKPTKSEVEAEGGEQNDAGSVESTENTSDAVSTGDTDSTAIDADPIDADQGVEISTEVEPESTNKDDSTVENSPVEITEKPEAVVDAGDIADDEDDGNNEDPKSIAAIIETDSISEDAPDEPVEDDSSEEAKPAKKAPRKTTRRPRKKAVKPTDDADEQPVAEALPETPVEKQSETEPEANETQAAREEPQVASGDSEEVSEDKPVKTRRRRSRKPREAKEDNATNEENGDADSESASDTSQEVESVGQEDAMEEMPRPSRATRRYRIQEVIKRRQVLLIQVVKEERGNKGAALTTYLSLAGRYSVLMPNTARGGGISRKITNSSDRKRLKSIANELEVPDGMGVILRTAGATRTKEDINRDFEYLMRLWENVRNLTLSSSAPNLVYEEGNLVKRSIRDLFDKDTTEVLVAGETGHKQAHDFMTMLMPNQADKVKLYSAEKSLFANFGIEQQLDKMLVQQVTLKSGGYLVINQTEALVAIDVNSGRSTKEHSIEDTALRTNVEAAEEVARQLRLRDLAGLIVIDFIDMEEKRNNRTVEKKLKDSLKNDRARIQVGRISHFGLMEMSRQRMRASVLESTMEICNHCDGRGHLRSHSSISLQIIRGIEEQLLQNSRFDIIVKAPSDTALYVLNNKRQALVEIETRFGVNVQIVNDHVLRGENFTIEKGEASTGDRIPVNHVQPDQIEEVPLPQSSQEEDNSENRSPRKRRRRRGNKSNNENENDNGNTEASETQAAAPPDSESETDEDADNNKRKRRRGKRGGRKRRENGDSEQNQVSAETATDTVNSDKADAPEPVVEAAIKTPEPAAEEETQPRSRNSRPGRRKTNEAPVAEKAVEKIVETVVEKPETNDKDTSVENSEEATTAKPSPPRRARRATSRKKPEVAAVEETSAPGVDEAKQNIQSATPEPEATAPVESSENSTEEPSAEKDKKGGWWSRQGFFK